MAGMTARQPAGEQLTQLITVWAQARQDEADAKALKDEMVSRIKEQAQAYFMDHDEVPTLVYESDAGHVQITHKEGWRVDTARIKREQPALYAAYAVQTHTLELREVKP